MFEALGLGSPKPGKQSPVPTDAPAGGEQGQSGSCLVSSQADEKTCEDLAAGEHYSAPPESSSSPLDEDITTSTSSLFIDSLTTEGRGQRVGTASLMLIPGEVFHPEAHSYPNESKNKQVWKHKGWGEYRRQWEGEGERGDVAKEERKPISGESFTVASQPV